MQSRIVVFAVAAFALIMGSVGASAQQLESRLIGTITDPNGSSLPGVTVTATSTTTGAVRTATSDDQGRYTLTNLAPGSYHLSIELSGFAPVKREIALRVGDARPVDVA